MWVVCKTINLNGFLRANVIPDSTLYVLGMLDSAFLLLSYYLINLRGMLFMLRASITGIWGHRSCLWVLAFWLMLIPWSAVPLHGTDVTNEPLANVSLFAQHKPHQSGQAWTYGLFAASQQMATSSLPQEEISSSPNVKNLFHFIREEKKALKASLKRLHREKSPLEQRKENLEWQQTRNLM